MKNDFFKYNSYFNNKKMLLVFLLLLIGTMVPSFSGYPTTNFWYRLIMILTNPINNFLIFMAIGLNIIYAASEFTSSYYVINRIINYKSFIKRVTKDIIISSIYIYSISIILAIAGSFMFCFGQVSPIIYANYDISIIWYLVFFLARGCFLIGVVSSIFYYILVLFKKNITFVFVFMVNALFAIVFNSKIIYHFYQMPLLYHSYFIGVNYGSFYLEIICTILQSFILLVIYKVLYMIVVKKKRDVL